MTLTSETKNAKSTRSTYQHLQPLLNIIEEIMALPKIKSHQYTNLLEVKKQSWQSPPKFKDQEDSLFFVQISESHEMHAQDIIISNKCDYCEYEPL